MGHRGNRDENHWKNKNRMRRIKRGLQPESNATKDNESALVTSKMKDDKIAGEIGMEPVPLVSENASKEGQSGKERDSLESGHGALKTDMNGIALVDDSSGGDEKSGKMSLEALRVKPDQNSWGNNGSRNKRSQPESVLDISIDNSLIITRLLNAFAIEAALANNEFTEAEIAREALQMSSDTNFDSVEEKKVLEVGNEVKKFANDVDKKCEESTKPCEGLNIIEEEMTEVKKSGVKLVINYGNVFQEGAPLSVLAKLKTIPAQIEEYKDNLDNLAQFFKDLKSNKIDPKKRKGIFFPVAGRIINISGAADVFENKLTAQELEMLKAKRLEEDIDGIVALGSVAAELANRNQTLPIAQNKQKSFAEMAQELSRNYPKEVVEQIKNKLGVLSLNSYFPPLSVNEKNITCGFPNGAADFGQLVLDKKSGIVNKLILNGSPDEAFDFHQLQSLNTKIQPVYKSLQSGENMVVAERNIANILDGATATLDDMLRFAESTKDIQVITVFKGPNNIDLWKAEKLLAATVGETAKNFLMSMGQHSTDLPNFKKFFEAANIENSTWEPFFKFLETYNVDDLIKELTDKSNSISALLQMKEMASWFKGTKIDTLYPEAKTWFETSGAAAAIKTIQPKDNSKKSKKSKRVKRAAQLNEKMSGLRELQKLYPGNKYFVQLLKTVEYVNEWKKADRQMMKSLNKKIVNQSSNQKHSFNVTKPFDVIRQLGFANKFLLDLKKAKSAEVAINKLLKAEKEIDNHINSTPDPVLKAILKRSWTPEKKKTLRQLSGIVKQLEKKVTQVPNTIEGYGDLFKNDENLDGLSDVNLAEFVDLLLKTECPSVDKATGEKLKGLNLEFANGKLKMKSGLEAFIKTLPFLTAFSAPALLNIGQKTTTEAAPESTDWSFVIGICSTLLLVMLAAFLVPFSIFCCKLSGQPDRVGTIDPGRMTKNEVIYKCPKGVIIVEPETNVSIDDTEVGVRRNQDKTTELSLEDTQVESDKAVEQILAKNKEMHARIMEAKNIGKEQNGFRAVCRQSSNINSKFRKRNFTYDELKTISQKIIQDVDVSKNRNDKLKFEPRAKVDYSCGIGIDIYEEDELLADSNDKMLNTAKDESQPLLPEKETETTKNLVTAEEVSEASVKLLKRKSNIYDNLPKVEQESKISTNPSAENLLTSVTNDPEHRELGGSDEPTYGPLPRNIETNWNLDPSFYLETYKKDVPEGYNEEENPDDHYPENFYERAIIDKDGQTDYTAVTYNSMRKAFVERKKESSRKPVFSQNFLMKCLSDAKTHCHSQNALLKLNRKKTRLVGDIHGNFDDLIRHVSLGLADESTFVFMGDYVDRGKRSIEVLIFLISLIMMKNQQVYLLRGNHELPSINIDNGFLSECIAEYGDRGGREVWKAANEFFAELPIACVLNEKIFVAHGGISRLMLKGKEVFNSIKKRPETAYEWKLFIDILWSDPDGSLPLSRDYKLLFPVNKNRTRDADRYTSFGLIEVLKEIGMECLVRAHQVVTHGYEPFCATRCFTSYGSTNNSKNNNAAQTIVYDDSTVEFIRFKNMNIEKKPEETEGDTTRPRKSKGSKSKHTKKGGRKNRQSKNPRRSTSLENGNTK